MLGPPGPQARPRCRPRVLHCGSRLHDLHAVPVPARRRRRRLRRSHCPRRHVRRGLPSIIADGCLWSDAEVVRRVQIGGDIGTTIGMSSLKEQRQTVRQLSSDPGLYVGQCVPFYFCPRSVMPTSADPLVGPSFCLSLPSRAIVASFLLTEVRRTAFYRRSVVARLPPGASR